MSRRHVLVPLLVAAFASLAFAQKCPVPYDPTIEVYPSTALNYPLPSDQYAVQYKLGGGGWIDAKAYISKYGGTVASPFHTYSGYPQDMTSMSFVSIPVDARTPVALRVTKLAGSGFPTMDHVSVRPRAKGIEVDSVSSSVVQLSTKTSDDFAGEQFILWWDGGDSLQNGGTQGLAFFLDPPYDRPTGSNVKKIAGPADLIGDDLPQYDTLDFEGTVDGTADETAAYVFDIPANIRNVFLAPGAWARGKMRFEQTGNGQVRRLYGPGVLDASRFNYSQRQCRNSPDPAKQPEGYQALSWDTLPAGGTPDTFLLDGIIIADYNYYATTALKNSVVNNMKIIGWNGNNDGFQLDLGTRASNVFVRTGDDSLKMWGGSVTVTNATVWQNFNGGVVNLGWIDNSPGDDGLIDGLYVVKTDWRTPTDPSWIVTSDDGPGGQNNAIIASMMIPGTQFGTMHTSVYRSIYVEDPPRVLFSLKILPKICTVGSETCSNVVPLTPSKLNLKIENVFTPASLVENSIGFQTLADGSTTLTGSMKIGLKNVFITLPDGKLTLLTKEDAGFVGKLGTNGDNIDIDYGGDEHDQVSGWFSAWTAAQGAHYPGSTLPSSSDTNSVRMIVRPTISGNAVRVKIENTNGTGPVAFSAAYIGKAQSGAAVTANTQLTFNDGSLGLTLNPGDGAYSDPLPFSVTAFTRYAVSLDVATPPKNISGHELGLVTNYMVAGAHAADPSDTGFAEVPNPNSDTFPVYWVAAVDVRSSSATGTVVAIGDSITDGQCSTRTHDGAASPFGVALPDVYNRWTDLLAARFAGLPESQSKAVADEGIAGNTVVSNGKISVGLPTLFRVDNDALFREGVTHVILFEGTNDLGNGAVAGDVITADELIIDRAHTAGVKIIGATIIPRGAESAVNWTHAMELQRVALNDWIRHQAGFDGVIDFDALMQGPPSTTGNNAVTLRPQWSCFDHVHPNSDGYAAMAAFIDLSLFRTHDH
jgi:lysophospholipase L1-like esterase